MQEEEFDQKLKEIDSKISYMKQVINGRNYPIQNKKAAGKSLSELEKQRDKLLLRKTSTIFHYT